MTLPAGVKAIALDAHRDGRGSFTEIMRESWGLGLRPVQWNLVHSEPGVVRGVHVHVVHSDYFLVVSGSATLGLADLRQRSPTPRASAILLATGRDPTLIVIPRGVAHGFMFHEASIHIYSVTHYWDQADELGCRWDDPALGIPWPKTKAILSARDAEAKSLDSLLMEMEPHQAGLYESRPDPA